MQKPVNSPVQHVDVVIIGAGISGISAAYHLQKYCPNKSFAILEGRDGIGGTWDFFRYPGVRSDSDMFTLGYSFAPWNGGKMFADGPSIQSYVNETARNYAIDKEIRFNHKVKKANWSSEKSSWTLEIEVPGIERYVTYSCNFIFGCSGYYDYDKGYEPEFAGSETFKGEIIHPQHWPKNLDYADKNVAIIGSGATAVTILPAMAKAAKHISMVQRSPTYIVAVPDSDLVSRYLGPLLPSRLVHAINRWKYISLVTLVLKMSQWAPKFMRKAIRENAREILGPDFDVDTHFNPRYKPWDQRLCADPDGLFYKSIAEGKASIFTDEIECFTAKGLQLKSGATVDADIIITATGLKVIAFGGVEYAVDGKAFHVNDAWSYKGMMFSDLPNFIQCFGYAQAGSYTLKVDLTCQYACRLLGLMDQQGYAYCVPRNDDPNLEESDAFSTLTSGYVQRARQQFPKMSDKAPWRRNENYFLDLLETRFRRIEEKGLIFYRVDEVYGEEDAPAA